MAQDKIKIKRLKQKEKTIKEQTDEIMEDLGLILYDFQKVLIYIMNFYTYFIFAASRGLKLSI